MDKNNEIEILPWHHEFDVGIESIDEQHKQLVYLLNKLANTLKYDEGFETEETFKELANYANFHFESEEKIWEENLPEELVNLHKYTHDSFLPKVMQLKEKNKDKPKHLIIEEILKFLIRWLSYHIISDDKKLATMVIELKKGKTPKEAKQIAEKCVETVISQLADILFSLYENLSSNTLSLLREKELLSQIEQQNIEINNYLEALNKVAIVSKTDLKGIITYVNDSFCEISEYSKEELLGKTHNIIRHEDVPKSVFKELWDFIQNGETWEGTLKNKSKSDKTYYVQSTVFPLYDKDGKINEYMGIRFLVTDEAKRKRDFKHKVLLSHQQFKKDIKEYQEQITELETNYKKSQQENSYFKEKIITLEFNNNKLKSQINHFEKEIKEFDSLSSNKLNDRNLEIIELKKQHQENLKKLNKDKEAIRELVEDTKTKSEEVIRLNNQVINQNKTIQDLKETIEHLALEDNVKSKEGFLGNLFNKKEKS